MNERIFSQLAELAKSFNSLGTRPVVCGGLGVYLCFEDKLGDNKQILRATTDIDLMLLKSQVLEQAQRNSIAEIITNKLEYRLRDDGEGKCFRFEKSGGQELDVLAPPMDFINNNGDRARIVKSKLHGRLIKEAVYIDEDLRIIDISRFLKESQNNEKLEIAVPSPTNLLILKLFAFNDRRRGERQLDVERAQTHAWDIYAISTLADRADYKQGQVFLEKHRNSDIIKKALAIVEESFSDIEKTGWQHVLEASVWDTDITLAQRRQELENAKNRLIRWFTIKK
ncbi:MAG: hypothetical protein FVQ80_10940 [Planctomycetes bacterium]|nr:hypothetical protein [Planctomycetota bacterium]